MSIIEKIKPNEESCRSTSASSKT